MVVSDFTARECHRLRDIAYKKWRDVFKVLEITAYDVELKAALNDTMVIKTMAQ